MRSVGRGLDIADLAQSTQCRQINLSNVASVFFIPGLLMFAKNYACIMYFLFSVSTSAYKLNSSRSCSTNVQWKRLWQLKSSNLTMLKVS